jgi:hypothetical protein
MSLVIKSATGEGRHSSLGVLRVARCLGKETKHWVARYLSSHRFIRGGGGSVEVGRRHPHLSHVLAKHRDSLGWGRLDHAVGL